MLASLVGLSGDKPEVKYYEGFEGLEAMRDILLQSGAKSLDSVTSQQYQKTVPLESTNKHEKKFHSKGIHNRAIYFTNQTDRPKYGKRTSGSGVTEFKNIQTNSVGDFGEVSVFGQYVALIVYMEKPYGFIVKSKQIAKTASAMFEAFWKSL